MAHAWLRRAAAFVPLCAVAIGCGGKEGAETATGAQAAVPAEYVQAEKEMVDFMKSQAKKAAPRRPADPR